jgi:hypothetical protein
MTKDNTPFLSDEFLDEVAKEIYQLYGGGQVKQDEVHVPTDNGEQ